MIKILTKKFISSANSPNVYRVSRRFFSEAKNESNKINFSEFMSMNSLENAKIQNSQFNDEGEYLLYLNNTIKILQVEWGKIIRKSFLFPMMSTLFYFSGNFFFMSLAAAYSYIELKSLFKNFRKVKKLCHRIVLIEDEQFKEFLCIYFMSDPSKEIHIKKDSIKFKSFNIGLDSMLEKVHKKFAHNKNERNFELNRFKMQFDGVDEFGAEWKNMEIVYGENECEVEDWEKFWSFFGRIDELKNEQ